MMMGMAMMMMMMVDIGRRMVYGDDDVRYSRRGHSRVSHGYGYTDGAHTTHTSSNFRQK